MTSSVRVCLCAVLFLVVSGFADAPPETPLQEPATAAAPESPAARPAPVIRIEAICPFSVRALFREPDRIPRLWRRLENAAVQTFPADPMPLEELQRIAGTRALEHERLIVSHLGLLAARPSYEPVLVADGLLLPSLRELADRIGEPRLSAAPPAASEWLRARLGRRAHLRPGATPPTGSSEEDLLRSGGYRLLPEMWEGATYRPATRTLLLASAELKRAPGLPMVVLLAVPAGPTAEGTGHWEEFMATIDLLAIEAPDMDFDLWLWGKDAGGATETVRISWGPAVKQAWVYHQDRYASFFHPNLRHLVRDVIDQNPNEAPPVQEDGGK